MPTITLGPQVCAELPAGGPLTRSPLQKSDISLGLVFPSDAAIASTR